MKTLKYKFIEFIGFAEAPLLYSYYRDAAYQSGVNVGTFRPERNIRGNPGIYVEGTIDGIERFELRVLELNYPEEKNVKTRIEEIVASAIKEGRISSWEGVAIFAAVKFCAKITDTDHSGLKFAEQYGTLTVDQLQLLVSE